MGVQWQGTYKVVGWLRVVFLPLPPSRPPMPLGLVTALTKQPAWISLYVANIASLSPIK